MERITVNKAATTTYCRYQSDAVSAYAGDTFWATSKSLVVATPSRAHKPQTTTKAQSQANEESESVIYSVVMVVDEEYPQIY